MIFVGRLLKFTLRLNYSHCKCEAVCQGNKPMLLLNSTKWFEVTCVWIYF